MKRKIITTGDGSTTIQIEEWNEQYHSKHGAIQEAKHVFIKHGFEHVKNAPLSILEIGFGTGLNAFITYLENLSNPRPIQYVGVEAYPVNTEELQYLNYAEALAAQNHKKIFTVMHNAAWGQPVTIAENFSLHKLQRKFQDIEAVAEYHLIYFDAFGARVQPELWTEAIFKKMFTALKTGGILVTYAAKGSVRRAMQAVGFTVERLPGPPGKREMLRATKIAIA
ncbi:tRNA (5-methylaminomethyl-2-thiouridine)(34)-methyltransferase MnmD [Flavobacterium sp. ASW18X]|uniref:tRNA (5-methylaminomethyl-2-thiouridine)(34)-methyltransferase MnmD n=1 Tax=Flavobacterium sp. ASW18X TaxID=2572595 RepID=UPI0010AEB8E5|nr:tRNA (5-methylaminomethyl-2-thiouridine)(34)-methyltransferase MnmD [Flavobacterium sp. ASW18X]TKD61373.1 SAM-dependent methyltransferase [Flavobacterium sp. ASW18X]